ncbi:hypothetical protein TI39_contig555g00004 [Zymoseptoria brevis]|uniref:Uncharacterized protein n=1 Tax=Zymoseptoria brevis TaxID=1047168 RepID=A0A0F4GI60_9PEZI|nr:hypothetical protein TI39_contig555g00004 [Zymoseptoria brevis]
MQTSGAQEGRKRDSGEEDERRTKEGDGRKNRGKASDERRREEEAVVEDEQMAEERRQGSCRRDRRESSVAARGQKATQPFSLLVSPPRPPSRLETLTQERNKRRRMMAKLANIAQHKTFASGTVDQTDEKGSEETTVFIENEERQDC